MFHLPEHWRFLARQISLMCQFSMIQNLTLAFCNKIQFAVLKLKVELILTQNKVFIICLQYFGHMSNLCSMLIIQPLMFYFRLSRYCLYSRWKNEAGERIPSLIRVRGNSLQRIKHIMKRVSKENIKPQGRLIGKLSHAAPAFLFDYMLVQVCVRCYKLKYLCCKIMLHFLLFFVPYNVKGKNKVRAPYLIFNQPIPNMYIYFN